MEISTSQREESEGGMKKRVISIIIMLAFMFVTYVEAMGSEPDQISMTLDEYLETSDEAWFLTGKKEYYVQAMMVSGYGGVKRMTCEEAVNT